MAAHQFLILEERRERKERAPTGGRPRHEERDTRGRGTTTLGRGSHTPTRGGIIAKARVDKVEGRMMDLTHPPLLGRINPLTLVGNEEVGLPRLQLGERGPYWTTLGHQSLILKLKKKHRDNTKKHY